jgi:hypothetical protein
MNACTHLSHLANRTDPTHLKMFTELSRRAKAALPPGADRIHIYDTPLEVLAGLLAIGFVLTLLVRPLRHSQRPAEDTAAA